jgi:uncharacterized protein YcbK (DUF882 family)
MSNELFKKTFCRRSFLALSAGCVIGAALGQPLTGHARQVPADAISFYHTHTGEKLIIPGDTLTSQVVRKVTRFLRDFRTGGTHPIDPALLHMLAEIKKISGCKGTFEVISGYRSPVTNEKLRQKSGGVAKKSLHTLGRAIDVRLTGLKTSTLKEIAWSLQQGGVGYYPKSDFVHLDTGAVRTW